MALARLLAAPVAVESQAAKVYQVGFLGLSSASDYAPAVQAFRQGLRELGYEEGKNISIETVGRRGVTSVFRRSPANWFGSTLTCS